MKKIILLVAVMMLSGCGHFGHSGHKCKWKAMDANSDGKVSKKEFTDKHAEKFAGMDADKDGFVTMEEKKAYKGAKKCGGCGKSSCDVKK